MEAAIANAVGYRGCLDAPGCAADARPEAGQMRLWGICDDRIQCSNATEWPWPKGKEGWPWCGVPASVPPGAPQSIQSLVGGRDGCSPWHFPPAFDAGLATSYTKDCNSFCVVRDPLQRLLSQISVMYGGRVEEFCSPKGLEDNIRKYLDQVDLKGDCHFVPQAYYVFQNGDPKAPKICHHMLRFETIHEEFKELMATHNMSQVRLARQYVHGFPTRCQVEPTRATLELVRDFYSVDYEAFGYTIGKGVLSL